MDAALFFCFWLGLGREEHREKMKGREEKYSLGLSSSVPSLRGPCRLDVFSRSLHPVKCPLYRTPTPRFQEPLLSTSSLGKLRVSHATSHRIPHIFPHFLHTPVYSLFIDLFPNHTIRMCPLFPVETLHLGVAISV